MDKESKLLQIRKLEVISFKNSHELRGPVATILGLIQLIEHDRIDGTLLIDIVELPKKTVVKLDNVISEINQNTY